MRAAIGFVLFGLLHLPSAALAEDLGDAAGFSARSVTYQEGNRAAAEEYKVYLAPQGKRIEGIPPRDLTIVSPAGSSKRWFVDPDAKVYAVDPNRQKGQRLGGVLSHEPCLGFDGSERAGTEEVVGRETEKWVCTHQVFGEVVQWFDRSLNTVIKDRTAKGEVQVLRDIKVGPHPEHLFRFRPGEGFQRVAVIQLFQ